MICKLKYYVLLISIVLLSACASTKPIKKILGDLEDRYTIFDKYENIQEWKLIHFAAAVGTRE